MLALKQEENRKKLEKLADLGEFIGEYKEAFDRYSEKLEKVLSSLESLLRQLRVY